jgi:hypothetical protein
MIYEENVQDAPVSRLPFAGRLIDDIKRGVGRIEAPQTGAADLGKMTSGGPDCCGVRRS